VLILREIVEDETPDASYLEQEGFEKRRGEYNRGDFSFVGVRAVAEIHMPMDRKRAVFITSRIRSPGVWGIESDSGEDYFNQVFEDETEILMTMLNSLRNYKLIKE